MFNVFPKSEFKVVAPDGTVRGMVKGIFDPKVITVPDTAALIMAGDEMRRTLPNGTEEAFEVLDPVYHETFHAIPAHYQVKIRRKGAFPAGRGGNFNITLSGNARLNLNSNDHSTNIIADNSVFGEIRSALKGADIETEKLDRIIQALDAMEAARSNRSTFASAYQNFIKAAAEHITVISPFLPALGQMLI